MTSKTCKGETMVRRRILYVGKTNIYHRLETCGASDVEMFKTDDEGWEKLNRLGLLCKRCCYGFDPHY